jgi:hypothetical protein
MALLCLPDFDKIHCLFLISQKGFIIYPMNRIASINRKTAETQIDLKINLDGTGVSNRRLQIKQALGAMAA